MVSATGVWARAEFRLGGPNGNAWENLLTRQAVSYVVVDEAGNTLATVPVTVVAEDASGDLLSDYGYRFPTPPAMQDNILQPVWIDPEENLILAPSLHARNGHLSSSTSTSRVFTESVPLQALIDGDPETTMLRQVDTSPRLSDEGLTEAQLSRQGRTGRLEALNTSNIKNMVINLGAELPVNCIRFYPRPGFEENYLAWYEIGVADDTAPFANYQGQQRPGLRWYMETDRILNSPNDSALDILVRNEENLDVVVDLRFPTRDLRFVALRPLDPDRTWELAEWEIYGEGFVTHTVYRTEILDFGRPVAWSKIRWEGEIPPGTQLFLRTRTGNAPQPNRFWKVGATGKFEEVSVDEYLVPFTAGSFSKVNRTYDVDHWSFWSAPYPFAAGLRDPSTPSEAWIDGTSLLSPGPSRYLQFEIVMVADRAVAPRLENLSLLFAEEPAAQAVIGEIWPVETESFAPQTFTYVVRPLLRPGDRGFDRLEIFTQIPADTVHSVKVDGEEVIDRFPPEIHGDRIVVSFAPRQAPQDDEKRIEVVFDARVLRFGAEFTGWVYDSGQPALKQQIQAGNATFRLGGDVLSVRTPMGGDLISRLQARPSPFTPNGDGVNDQVQIAYDLRDLDTPQQLTLRIFALGGRMVREVVAAPSRSGSFDHAWDGRDDSDRVVPPGLYLYQVDLATDEGNEVSSGILSVAY